MMCDALKQTWDEMGEGWGKSTGAGNRTRMRGRDNRKEKESDCRGDEDYDCGV